MSDSIIIIWIGYIGCCMAVLKPPPVDGRGGIGGCRKRFRTASKNIDKGGASRYKGTTSTGRLLAIPKKSGNFSNPGFFFA